MTEFTLLAIACGAGTYVWRALGVAVAARVRPESELFAWVGCVAYAMIAGLVSRIFILPSGVLEQTLLWHRMAAIAVAFLVYFYLSRRNLFTGVVSSGVAMYAILTLLPRG
jgi:branched-subunit amino acid transport protein